MKLLKPRDKTTQRMTRARLTPDNQTIGKNMSISSRKAEPGYAAKSDGTAEKALERAVGIRDRHKTKQTVRYGDRMAKEANGPASRLQFTTKERVSLELAPYTEQTEERADRPDIAKSAPPNRRMITGETVHNGAEGKARGKFHFRKVEEHPPKPRPNPTGRPMQEAGLYPHRKIHEMEQENVGMGSGHRAKGLAGCQAGKALRNVRRRHKLEPYRATAKIGQKSVAANAEFAYQKSLRDSPKLAQAVSNPISRLWQGQCVKRECAKVVWAAGRGMVGSARTTASTARKAAEKGKQAASLVTHRQEGVLLIGDMGLLFILIMGGLQSYAAMFDSAGTGLAVTSHLSEDSDMPGAEVAYAGMEANLQYELDHYEILHPGHDEYRLKLDETGHDSYVLTSILSALHNGVFILEGVQGDLAMFFEQQYILTECAGVEIRYRMVTRTDSDGNEYEGEVPYRYSICYVALKDMDLSRLPVYLMIGGQLSLYVTYTQTPGSRQDLFPSGSYPNAFTIKKPICYEIPPETLRDEAFVVMTAEVDEYAGYPYVWGGSSPSTSFNYSGFISWVFNHSEWGVGRQTVQRLYNLCTPITTEQTKPGDLVFFVGIYGTPGVSHVGLYMGNSVMLHHGDPISYTDLNSSYWQIRLFCYEHLS